MEVEKLGEQIDIWKVWEAGVPTIVKVHQFNKKITKVEFVSMGNTKTITNFQLKAILRIIEEGEYDLGEM